MFIIKGRETSASTDYARLYPCVLWFSYHVPICLLGLRCCSDAKQICEWDLCGESIWASGTGKWLGNCCTCFLNPKGMEITYSSQTQLTLCMLSSGLSSRCFVQWFGFESIVAQRSQEASSHQHRSVSLGCGMCLSYSFVAGSWRCFLVW